MLETSARLLRLLSLLQTRKDWSGAELADKLAITPRTVRRDVDRLRELGYPVDATVGVGGGYRLGAGAEMPPLQLDDEEVLAVALSLQSGATGSVVGIGDASLRALSKLRQIMPSRLRHRLESLQIDVVQRAPADSAVDAGVLSAIASVCHRHERLRFDYSTHDGTASRREVEPYRLVRSGVRWYLVAWDLSREDWRSFRVDRLEPKIPTGPRFLPRDLPPGGAAEFVSRGVTRLRTSTQATILLHAPIEQIAPMMSERWGTIESAGDDRCVIVLSGTTLRSIAQWIRVFDVDFTVVDPPELRDECRSLGSEYSVTVRRYLGA
ncbi:putative DNA-binding transcriptional regulator YafY [Rhodococcus sp. 27YEA15]|uniref:helix-turn-helix transcriptional regulator n=1 Tax=Rhodococcus sp. 27YEA15 TaxID=3156259 RepID=UPI003C7EA659